jgi:hypothetical protein
MMMIVVAIAVSTTIAVPLLLRMVRWPLMLLTLLVLGLLLRTKRALFP